jgi:hypothetical protein
VSEGLGKQHSGQAGSDGASPYRLQHSSTLLVRELPGFEPLPDKAFTPYMKKKSRTEDTEGTEV